MPSRYRIVINVIGFQLGWFSCVLMAAQNKPSIGIVISMIVIALHLYLVNNKLGTLGLLFTITLLGGAWDSLLTSTGILVFNSGIIVQFLAPSWIIVMWLLFATTLNVSLRWLYNRTWLAMLTGAVAGPLAYQGGAALGAVVIPDTVFANTILAIGWSVLLPLSIKVSQVFETSIAIRTAEQ